MKFSLDAMEAAGILAICLLFGALVGIATWWYRSVKIHSLSQTVRAERNARQLLLLKLGLEGITVQDVPAQPATIKIIKPREKR